MAEGSTSRDGKTLREDTTWVDYKNKKDDIILKESFQIALLQMRVGKDKRENVQRAVSFINRAKSEGSKMVVLPECFNCPYGSEYFAKFAEEIPGGQTCNILSQMARKNRLFIVGGSIPEKENNKYYNTCTVWDPRGSLIAKHRKVHLFDIDIPGKIRFKESETLTPGTQLTTFDTPMFKFDSKVLDEARAQIPVFYQRRIDLYDTIKKEVSSTIKGELP
ncbi:hypothetical protein C0J52_08140 [Blattella germanica]|nr:hypothetical protein C0J52_08140 [Blattella germanica]